MSMLPAHRQASTLRYPDPFPPEVVEAAKAHACESYPRESCGYVTEHGYVPAENVHETPETNFRIDPEFTKEVYQRGKVLAIVHSHPNGPNYPSFMDQQVQIEMGVTWGIIPVFANDADGTRLAGDVIWWGDDLPIPPLQGRRFIWGVFHCWSFYRHWFKLEHDIWLPNFACPIDFIDEGVNIFLDNCERAGLRNLGKVDMCDLQIGDMLVGHVKGEHPNHCGVYVGGDDLLHHLDTGVSRKDQLVRRWPHIDTVFRYAGADATSLRDTG